MGTERAGGLNRGPLLFGSNLEQSVSFEFALAFGMLHPTLVVFIIAKLCVDCLTLLALLTGFSAFTQMASMASWSFWFRAVSCFFEMLMVAILMTVAIHRLEVNTVQLSPDQSLWRLFQMRQLWLNTSRQGQTNVKPAMPMQKLCKCSTTCFFSQMPQHPCHLGELYWNFWEVKLAVMSWFVIMIANLIKFVNMLWIAHGANLDKSVLDSLMWGVELRVCVRVLLFHLHFPSAHAPFFLKPYHTRQVSKSGFIWVYDIARGGSTWQWACKFVNHLRWVKFKMLVEFQMKNGHWEVKPGALSDVDITFGNGGAVECLGLSARGWVEDMGLSQEWSAPNFDGVYHHFSCSDRNRSIPPCLDKATYCWSYQSHPTKIYSILFGSRCIYISPWCYS